MVDNLFFKLRKLGANVDYLNGELEIDAPKGAINDALINEIKFYKEDLVDFILKNK